MAPQGPAFSTHPIPPLPQCSQSLRTWDSPWIHAPVSRHGWSLSGGTAEGDRWAVTQLRGSLLQQAMPPKDVYILILKTYVGVS